MVFPCLAVAALAFPFRRLPPASIPWAALLPVLLVPLLSALVATPGASVGAAEEFLIPLECRLGDGPWQACQMRVEQVGGHWWLLIGERQLEFRHDGSGIVRMQAAQDSEGWRTVRSRWEDTSLCWDGICAKGDIPLD